jgi:hypothetical protein
MTDKQRHELLGKITDQVASALNTKFTLLDATPKEELTRIQKQNVMDVEEYTELATPLGDYKAWRGSTETNYFYIVFMKGVITVICEEREWLIGTRITTYAVLTKLVNMSKKSNSHSLFDTYNAEEYKEDMKNVTFEDVMMTLKWKFHSKKVKVKEGMTFPLI